MENALQALREYGQSIRGDWGSIDGRSIRMGIDDLADAIEHGSVHTIEYWRDRLGMCPSGEGHWTEHCDIDYCGSEPEW